MNTLDQIINDIISEAALDERIPDGVVNLRDSQHISIIAEVMEGMKIDENVIAEFVEEFMDEGKYPDRQAYNKEGWLVTFPSKEYRDRAIKKGTHSISDPTHGKGGMNLYYKRKGKQKRQAQQEPTATEPETPTEQPAVEQPAAEREPSQPAATPPASEPTQKDRAPGEVTSDMLGDEPEPTQPTQPGGKEKTSEPTAKDSDSELPPSGDRAPASSSDDKPSGGPSSAPAAPPPPPPPPFVELSKKFAAQKAWVPTPYGEWRDSQGNTVAVQALSGEIVPLKSTDREELKLFVQKHTPVP